MSKDSDDEMSMVSVAVVLMNEQIYEQNYFSRKVENWNGRLHPSGNRLELWLSEKMLQNLLVTRLCWN